jgi:iron complex transport system permease protein
VKRFLLLVILTAILIWLDLKTGTADFGDPAFIEFRLPRVLAAFLSGFALAISGLALQTMFRNPLAGPYLTGVTPGASFAVALLLMVLPAGFSVLPQFSGVVLALFGMAGGMGVMLLQLYISRKSSGIFTLLLTGVILGYLLGAGVEIMQSLAGLEQLKNFTMWGLGSFDRVQMSQIPMLLLVTLAGLLFIFLNRFKLDAYLPGDNYALSAGVDVKSLRLGLIVFTGLMAGTTTALCGPVGFVGMVAPHIARAAMKSNSHQRLLFITALTGSALCVLADLIAHHLFADITLNVNAIAAIIGAPVVLWAILRNRNA